MRMREVYLTIHYIKQRIMKIVLVLLVLISLYFYVSGYIIDTIDKDLKPKEVKIIATTMLEYPMVRLKIALVLAVLTLLPFLIYFSFRNLGKKLSRKSIPWILFGIILFLLGASFTYFILLPVMIKVLTGIALESGVLAYYTVSSFIFFVFITTVIFGVVFELPLIVTWLAINNYVSVETLKEKRRYVYVGIVIFAAAVTADPTPISQLILSVPLILLYEISIFIAGFIIKSKNKELHKEAVKIKSSLPKDQ